MIYPRGLLSRHYGMNLINNLLFALTFYFMKINFEGIWGIWGSVTCPDHGHMRETGTEELL